MLQLPANFRNTIFNYPMNNISRRPKAVNMQFTMNPCMPSRVHKYAERRRVSDFKYLHRNTSDTIDCIVNTKRDSFFN